VLVAVDVRKSYGSTQALRGVSMTVYAGETVGIVGPNGAGKTTFLECVEGIRRPDSGEVRICGQTRDAGPAVYHLGFGAQLQESSLAERLRVEEAVELFAAFYDEPWKPRPLLRRIGLAGQRRTFYRHLSGGQKRRLTLALALLGRPPVLLLDEPAAGLDTHARLDLWAVLDELTGSSTAVVLATHDLHEAQSRCDRVYVLDRGQVAAAGPVHALLRDAGLVDRVRLPYRPGYPAVLRGVPGWTTNRIVAGVLYAYGTDGYARAATAALAARDLAGAVNGTGGSLAGTVTSGPTTLEDLYLTQTGERDDVQ
jgi:ABC-2 type transport system ATP-binding protein